MTGVQTCALPIYPKGWLLSDLEEIGVELSDIPDDQWYKGLNLDEDCAVSELLCAVGQAYSWFADDYDWEDLSEKYKKRYTDLGLDQRGCAQEYDRLCRIADDVRKGKHDRNEHLWC